MRTEAIHLDNAFARYVRSCARLGWDTTGWMMSTGSKSQGQPYQVGVKCESGRTALPGTRDAGDIGRTRTEAYNRLSAISDTLDDVARFQGLL